MVVVGVDGTGFPQIKSMFILWLHQRTLQTGEI